jgi:hypothetical protein
MDFLIDKVKRRRVEIPLTGLTPPQFCAFSKPKPGFPISYVVVFILSSVS